MHSAPLLQVRQEPEAQMGAWEGQSVARLHCTQAPLIPQYGLPGKPVEQSLLMQARQRPLPTLQMGALPEHWAFEVHSTQAPVVALIIEYIARIPEALQSALW